MDYFSAMRVFVRAVELGSFSKAAAEAGVKVSTVSRYVTGLEADLGAALLNRSTRRLHLTEAGQGFFDRSVQILADVQEAREATRLLNARPQGLLRVALPSAFGRRHVIPHMKAFLEAYPDIRLDAALSNARLDLIDAGIDVAIRIGAMADSTLIARSLAVQTLALVASPAYLASHPPLRTPADLCRHDCLLADLPGTTGWYVRSRTEPDAAPVETSVTGRLRTNDLEALREAVVGGIGLALLPTWLCGADLQDGRIIAVLPHWGWTTSIGKEGRIWAIYPPKKIVSPKVKVFLAFLTERFGRPPYWERAPSTSLVASPLTAVGCDEPVTP